MPDRLKIAWLTPLAKQSAIGLFSSLVTAELSGSVDIDLWHPPARDLHPAPVRSICMTAPAAVYRTALTGYDLVVYNLGNHAGNHGAIFEVSREVPGIVILHDFVMHHFFAGHYLPGRSGDYARAMAAYGDAGRAAARAVLDGVRPFPWETAAAAEFPLFEEAVSGAWAVIAHSRFLAHRLRAGFSGIVKELPLAYAQKTGAVEPRSSLNVPPEHLLLLTVGCITAHRRIPAALEALAASPDLRGHFTWAILGSCEEPYRGELLASIRRLGLAREVRFSGEYAADAELRAWLAHADLCINLRYPATEGGSASLVEQMLAGKPVIVTDTGCYSELPDDCVRKVRIQHESEDLGSALRELMGNAPVRKRTGDRARRFAEQTFTVRRYAAGFLELAEELLDAKPLLALTDRLGTALGEMGAGPDSPIVQTVSAEVFKLFCTGRDEPAT